MFELEYECVYCGEPLSSLVDAALGSEPQSWIEDCQVCCAPMELTARRLGLEVELISIRGGNE